MSKLTPTHTVPIPDRPVYEIRLTNSTMTVENFVTSDFTTAYDKVEEYENDHKWNAGLTISLYEWQDGERIELETRRVY